MPNIIQLNELFGLLGLGITIANDYNITFSHSDVDANKITNSLNNESMAKFKAFIKEISLETLERLYTRYNNQEFKVLFDKISESSESLIQQIKIIKETFRDETPNLDELLAQLLQLELKLIIRKCKEIEKVIEGEDEGKKLLDQVVDVFHGQIQALNEYQDVKNESENAEPLGQSGGSKNSKFDINYAYKYAKYRIKYNLLKSKK